MSRQTQELLRKKAEQGNINILRGNSEIRESQFLLQTFENIIVTKQYYRKDRESKQAEYLNLALNNIKVIEGLEKLRIINEIRFETPLFLNDDKVSQCDESGDKPYVNNWEDPENVIFKMYISKYLDTSLIQVNGNPAYVSVRVKGKLTQIRLDEDVFSKKCKIQRSEITGVLVITMPKVNPNELLQQIAERNKKEEFQQQQEQIKQQEMK